ncbi:hypothetical protein BHM03_00026771 [Ensete ventricosum]|uniref:Uncharacterized protein n=1 Tax=Ensete ventricosum TaxID=4639 RepID=A0A445MHA1_ENSVE|nr:hypothetical protein BHM03_00026771 [Ensete ventricosum]
MIGLMVAEVCNLGTIRLKVAEVCNSGTIGLKVTEVCNSGTIRLKVVEVCDLGTIELKVTDVYDSGTIGLKVAEAEASLALLNLLCLRLGFFCPSRAPFIPLIRSDILLRFVWGHGCSFRYGGEAHPPPPLQQRRAPPLSVQAVATRSESFLTRQAGRRSEEFRVGEAVASLPCSLFRVVDLGYN